MNFGRRTSVYAFGELYQNTKSVSQTRTFATNRTRGDVFERDPFKVHSYNFHYAERPTIQQLSEFPCRFHDRWDALRKAQTDFLYRNGLSNPQSYKNTVKTNKLPNVQRSSGSTSEMASSTTEIFRRTSNISSNEPSVRRKMSRASQTTSNAIAELPKYDGLCQRLGTVASRSRCTISTSKRPSFASRESSVMQLSPYKFLPKYGIRTFCNDGTAQSRMHARETSKVMSEAVGTVGCPSDRRLGFTTSNETHEQDCTNASEGLLVSSDHIQCGRRRSLIQSEGPSFNTTYSRRTERNNIQNMQPSYLLGTKRMQHHLPEFSNARNIIFPQQQTTPAENICITIQNTPQMTSRENVIIQIQPTTATPNTKQQQQQQQPQHEQAQLSNRNRMNNLAVHSRRRSAPRGCNVASKCSVDAINKNTRLTQSKCSLNDAKSNLHQRIRDCELFFKREDTRLRQLTARAVKLDGIVPALDERIHREHTARCAPGSQSRQPFKPFKPVQPVKPVKPDIPNTSIAAMNAAKTRRLRSIYEKGITSLRELRQSINAITTNITPQKKPSNVLSTTSIVRNLSNTIHKDNTFNKPSTTTFTLPLQVPRHSAMQRSISNISVHRCVSKISKISNDVSNTVVQMASTSKKSLHQKSSNLFNGKINLYPERRKNLGSYK